MEDGRACVVAVESRLRLFLTKYLSGLLFVGLQVTVFSVLCFVVIGFKAGAWEPAIFRSSSGMWGVRGVTRAYYGGSGDQAVPADYNGDFSDDLGIFRSTSGLWAVRGVTRLYYGMLGDLPVTR